MINSIEGADWEGFPYFYMEFAKGVNVIIGKSHYGKSSLIRSINWVLENRPQGTSYFPHGKKKPSTEVAIDFADGGYINRLKNNSDNYYEASVENEPFSALRTGVPEQVTKLSNMTGINIQAQKDVHFFLAEHWTPGKRSKFLNKIVHLEEMDAATEIINSTISEMNSSYNSKSVELKEEEKKFKELEWVDKAIEFLDKISELETKIVTTNSKCVNIISIRDSIIQLNEQIDELPDMAALPFAEAILTFDENLCRKEDKEEEIRKLAASLRDLKVQEKGIDLPAPTELKKLEAFSAKIQDNKATVKQLQSIKTDLQMQNDMEEKALKIVTGKEKELNVLLKSIGICPLCDGKGKWV